MKKKLALFFNLFSKQSETLEAKNNDIKVKTIISLILAAGSLVLTIINIIVLSGKIGTADEREAYFMLISTICLTVLFLVCALLVGVFKLRTASNIITSIAIAGVFSFYAIIGGNMGFAILWIVIVPAVSTMYLSFKFGFFISLYFLIFLIVLFYIPGVNEWRVSCGFYAYNSEFVRRFPPLYAIAFVISMFLSGQKIYYANKSEYNSLFDPMTGIRNRRFYADEVNRLLSAPVPESFVVVSLDLNGLKLINDTYGHNYGDFAITETARLMKKVFDGKEDQLYRTGGDEFFAFIIDSDDKIAEKVQDLKRKTADVKIRDWPLSLSIGVAKTQDFAGMDISFLMSVAEKEMYKDKEQFYKDAKMDRRRRTI